VILTGTRGSASGGEPAIADDDLEIFRGLYDADYRIWKMVLIVEYAATTILSMAETTRHLQLPDRQPFVSPCRDMLRVAIV
jgi:hypothetical protein